MATFVPGRPITTDQPFIDVDPGLSVGTHRFQLVVVDAQGNQSAPDVQTVTVVRLPIGPVGPIGPIDPVLPIRPVTPVDPVRPIGTIGPSPVRPVRGPRGATKPQGSKRPRRGGT
ncbi:MAG: hypothetical protein Q7U76_08445 [Nitrospirota bacterium]|nr:hypothetical protein [Nitrospirota bacterium]